MRQEPPNPAEEPRTDGDFLIKVPFTRSLMVPSVHQDLESRKEFLGILCMELDLPSWRDDQAHICTCRQECHSSLNSAAHQIQTDCDKKNKCNQL